MLLNGVTSSAWVKAKILPRHYKVPRYGPRPALHRIWVTWLPSGRPAAGVQMLFGLCRAIVGFGLHSNIILLTYMERLLRVYIKVTVQRGLLVVPAMGATPVKSHIYIVHKILVLYANLFCSFDQGTKYVTV